MNHSEIHTFLTYLQSERSVQQFLKKCYSNMEGVSADKLSYQNSNAFIQYLKHAQLFLHTGKDTTTELKPILYFYGMVHLLKATLLTKRPHYPETTKLLAHGVSSRKRKRKDYTFLSDEVKIQHHGLFPYFSEHLYSIKSYKAYPNPIKISLLFRLIPEMKPLFNFNQEDPLIEIGKIGDHILTFPLQLLTHYHLTENAFLQRISKQLTDIIGTTFTANELIVELKRPLNQSHGPFLYNFRDRGIYFPSHRDTYLPISEVMIHYLLLYNLSMVSRYETEWWGDLFNTRTDQDFPFISHYLEHAADKVLVLLGQELLHMHLNSDNG